MTELIKLLDLSGKVAIVTGGASGIGFGIASRFAEAGAAVVIADLDEIAARQSTDKLIAQGLKVVGLQCDVSDEGSVASLVSKTIAQFSAIDILVNNAGIYPNKLIEEMTVLDFEKVLNVNLKGTYLCLRACAAQMIKQGKGGKIINITSIDAIHPSSVGLAHYDASKHGLWGLTKNAALEYAEHRIWINAIAPGGIATPGVAKLQQGSAGQDQQKLMDAFLKKIPMQRMGEPDDIGKVALFLASELSSYMTGAQIVVDGGALLS